MKHPRHPAFKTFADALAATGDLHEAHMHVYARWGAWPPSERTLYRWALHLGHRFDTPQESWGRLQAMQKQRSEERMACVKALSHLSRTQVAQRLGVSPRTVSRLRAALRSQAA